ncbi:unnamed protein product [Dimorphilus gyrociliatus]|uniref:Uncharacterized protein n=1 Tax=Dimorphilus gyrociliatus TaxID=2664684 RepID=A0A7I8WF97_9ANNE|nr:unnamed protein product [Dimorphilus gyrociliatus]
MEIDALKTENVQLKTELARAKESIKLLNQHQDSNTNYNTGEELSQDKWPKEINIPGRCILKVFPLPELQIVTKIDEPPQVDLTIVPEKDNTGLVSGEESSLDSGDDFIICPPTKGLGSCY